MKLNIKLVALFSFLFCVIVPINASEHIIKIGTIALAPYGMQAGDNLSGAYYEMANLIVNNAGYASNNTITPYARVRREIQYGNIDLTIMYQDSRMHRYVNYIASLPSKPIVIISLQGKSFKKIADLSGKTILHLRDGIYYGAIDDDKTITKYEVNSHILGIKMLIAGRADAMLGTLQTFQSAILEIEKKENIKVLLSEPLIIDIRTPWIQTSRDSSSYLDIEKLKKSFLQLEAKDVFNTLNTRYSQPAEMK